MMCNPNQARDIPPTGAKQNGFPTGSQLPDTSRFLCGTLGLLETSIREMCHWVDQLRENWLQKKLAERGMPSMFLEGVVGRNPEMIRLAGGWLRDHCYAWSADKLNTITLFQHGNELFTETLFELPHENPATHGYRTTFFQE
jgi:hypothetical protein